jgi:chromate transporter
MMELFNLYFVFAKVGLFTFGGGYAMIPLIQREVIIDRAWITMAEFTDMIAIAEVTPGPIAVNTATFVGYRLFGVFGGIIATLGVVTPSIIIILIIAALLDRYQTSSVIGKIFNNIRPGVVAIILGAGFIIGKETLVDFKGLLIAAGVFAGLASKKLHPILIIFIAALIGLWLY